MRRPRSVISSRLPMGVPTMYRQPPPGAAPFEGEGVCAAELCVGRFLDMDRSLARSEKAIVACVVYFSIPHQKKESLCAFVRVQMPEMRPEDGKNRKRGRSTLEKVPALRRQSGGAILCAGHSV